MHRFSQCLTVFLYTGFRKFIRFFYALLLLASVASWHEEIGKKLGEFIFMSELVSVKPSKDSNVTIQGRALYEGRKIIYFLRDDNGKVVEISK